MYQWIVRILLCVLYTLILLYLSSFVPELDPEPATPSPPVPIKKCSVHSPFLPRQVCGLRASVVAPNLDQRSGPSINEVVDNLWISVVVQFFPSAEQNRRLINDPNERSPKRS